MISILIAVVAGEGVGVELAQNIARAADARNELIGVDIAPTLPRSMVEPAATSTFAPAS